MAEKTLAENVAQVKADFKAIRDGFGEYFDDIYEEPTSSYGNYPFYTYVRGKDEGIEQGKQAQYLEWWGEYLNDGNPASLYNAFAGHAWNDTTFNPPHDICAHNSSNMFSYSHVEDIRGILARNNINLIFSEEGTQHYNVFSNSNTKYLPYLTLPTTSSCYGWFTNCSILIEVDGYECTASHRFETASGGNKSFQGCTELVKILFYGTIGSEKNLDIHWSTKLNRASILSLLQCLNMSVTDSVITLPSMSIDGATDTLALIQGDTELNTAYTQALANGYTITFA